MTDTAQLPAPETGITLLAIEQASSGIHSCGVIGLASVPCEPLVACALHLVEQFRGDDGGVLPIGREERLAALTSVPPAVGNPACVKLGAVWFTPASALKERAAISPRPWSCFESRNIIFRVTIIAKTINRILGS